MKTKKMYGYPCCGQNLVIVPTAKNGDDYKVKTNARGTGHGTD
jgi:hypothetical protein